MSGYQKRFGGGAWRFHGIHGGSEIYFAIPRGNSHLRKFPFSYVHTFSQNPTFKNISTLEGTFIKSPLGCPFLSNTPWKPGRPIGQCTTTGNNQQLLNEAEQDMKNSADRGGCYPPRPILWRPKPPFPSSSNACHAGLLGRADVRQRDHQNKQPNILSYTPLEHLP